MATGLTPFWGKAALIALLTFSVPSFGKDETPSEDKSVSPAKKDGGTKPLSDGEKRSGGDKKETKPDEPSLLDRLSRDLLKELDESPVANLAAPKEDKLDHAAKGMRTAGGKLGDSQTGDETRKIQEQVIRDLDDLIKQLQQPPPPNGGGGGGGSGGGGGGGGGATGRAGGRGSGTISRAQQLQKVGEGQAGRGQQSKQESEGHSQKSGGQDKKVAGGSEERTESERKAAEEAARKKKLELDVWGHLPPHLREQLLNTYGERMLPKYENLVKQFYEALSEQTESSPRRK